MNWATFSRYRILLVVVAVILVWQTVKLAPWLQSSKTADIYHGATSSGIITPVLVTVFYEALCPDSKNFIVRQLLPSVNKASRLLNVTLVPYGKAKTEESTNKSIMFTCQHGPTECLANKVHACAISKISNSNLLIAYVSCMISDNMVPELIGERCARKHDIEWKPILECSNSEKGNILLKEYGKMTDALSPKMTFVPTVLLDNLEAAVLQTAKAEHFVLKSNFNAHMNNGMSAGVDEIRLKMQKAFVEKGVQQLSHIIKVVWQRGLVS